MTIADTHAVRNPNVLAGDTWQAIKDQRPADPDALHDWIRLILGVDLARVAVCEGHSAPFDMLSHQFFNRPSLSLWHGPRGGGKSFMSGIDSHLSSRFNHHHGTMVLGGSYQQSRQIYKALNAVVARPKEDSNTVRELLRNEARYWNGSEIGILAASTTSVRGPHVPSLKLDEVDEIKTELREAAMGMSISTPNASASVLMTSTFHRVAGPMAELTASAAEGAFPSFTFCIFEVLERCPESRSGPWVGGDAGYEECPQCPIKPFCHADRLKRRDGEPKAKRSSGHYSIETLIQKARGVSARVFRSDYLCDGPSVEGTWFPEFDDTPGLGHVTEAAEFNPRLPVILAVDSGVRCGAVVYQVNAGPHIPIEQHSVNVFADYFAEGVGAFKNAIDIKALLQQRCNGRADIRLTDPSGSHRNSLGPQTVLAEYERAGLGKFELWPIHSVVDGLELLGSFLRSADGRATLRIHPRCRSLIDAFRNYKRSRVNGIWMDTPADPQHPFENMIDPLRSSLVRMFPDGRKKERRMRRVEGWRVRP